MQTPEATEARCDDCGHAIAAHDQPGDTDGMLSCHVCAAAGRICDRREEER